jgi:lysophospholipase L1-like esterase
MNASPRPDSARFHLTVLGDSLGCGTGASSLERGFTQILYRALSRSAKECSFTNLSVPGATVNDVLTWQLPRIAADADMILLVVGSNDVPTTTDPQTFAQEYGRLLGRIRAMAPAAHLVVTGIPNIALTPHVPEEAKPLVSTLCRILSTEMEMQAETHQAQFIDLFAITDLANAHVVKYLAEDRFHPSDRGYALIARGILAVLRG